MRRQIAEDRALLDQPKDAPEQSAARNAVESILSPLLLCKEDASTKAAEEEEEESAAAAVIPWTFKRSKVQP